MSRRHTKRNLGVAIAIVAAGGLSAGAFYATRAETAPGISTAVVSRGDIVNAVGATGTLEAVTTVLVGSQVSGSVQALYADFNSIVRKGTVIARLDPSLLETQAAQARANLVRAEADVERLRVTLADTETKRSRTEELAARKLISVEALETAVLACRLAEAQVRSAEAQAVQARAALNQAEVNVAKTVITSPIDGIVMARNVDVGQTVAASMQAPTLFVLAAELSRLQLNASIDEADVGSIRAGQPVQFQVDAYPNERFTGTVRQVRLEPVIAQNVVTYPVLVDVPNPELKLRPGMTANVTVEIARRDNVLRVTNAALRFRPTEAMRAVLAVEDEAQTATAEAAGTSGQQARPRVVPASFERQAGQAPAGADEIRGRVWITAGGVLRSLAVTLGATDGTYTELKSASLPEGAEVVTTVKTSGEASTSGSSSTLSPLFGTQGPGGRMPGGPMR